MGSGGVKGKVTSSKGACPGPPNGAVLAPGPSNDDSFIRTESGGVGSPRDCGHAQGLEARGTVWDKILRGTLNVIQSNWNFILQIGEQRIPGISAQDSSVPVRLWRICQVQWLRWPAGSEANVVGCTGGQCRPVQVWDKRQDWGQGHRTFKGGTGV